MVLETRAKISRQRAGTCSIAPDSAVHRRLCVFGYASTAGTVGGDGGLTPLKRQRLKELERENRELRRSNDILCQASAYFACRACTLSRSLEKVMPLLDKSCSCTACTGMQWRRYCPERITTVSSDIILINAASVRSAMTG